MRLSILSIATFIGASVVGTVAFAQPANDDCANAISVPTIGTVNGTTIGATDDGDPGCSSGSSPSVWYSVTPATDVQIIVDTCTNSTYDTALAAYSSCASAQIVCNDDFCGLQSQIQFTAVAGNTYYIRAGGFSTNSGTFTLTIDEGTPPPPPSIGVDVVYSDCQSIRYWGESNDVHAYSLGSFTCNIGDADMAWGGTNPLLAMNAFRVADGRIQQIGMSWMKNGTGAAAQNGCGPPCNGNGGSVLGAGCLDVYGSSFNGGHFVLGPRSDLNPFTGAYPGNSNGDTSVVGQRIQIAEADLLTPNAVYLVEGMYVAFDDAAAGNAENNASYKRVTVDTGNFDMTPVGSTEIGIPAIQAWADHGLGVGVPDASVQIQRVDVPNEGVYFVGSKVEDLGNGQWQYEYAIYNLNSDRAAGSLEIPIGSGVTVSEVGFHDVDYHSGEPYDNTDWSSVVGSSVTWSSPQTHAQDPNSNALRFGTLYNFWFTANSGPTTNDAVMGLFKPGTPTSVSFSIEVPSDTVATDPEFVRGDCDDNSAFNLGDAITALNLLFAGQPSSCPDACDHNGDGTLGLSDVINFLSFLFQGSTIPPALPYPDCGASPTPGGPLGCATFGACP